MNFDLTTAASGVPALFSPDPSTARRTLEFFTVDSRNASTRRAKGRPDQTRRGRAKNDLSKPPLAFRSLSVSSLHLLHA